MSTLRWIGSPRADYLARWLMDGARVLTKPTAAELAGRDDELVVVIPTNWRRGFEAERDAVGEGHRHELYEWVALDTLNPHHAYADASISLSRGRGATGWDTVWVAQGPEWLGQQQMDGLWLLDGVQDAHRLSVHGQPEIVLADQDGGAFEAALALVRERLAERRSERKAVVLRSSVPLTPDRVEALHERARRATPLRPVVHVRVTDAGRG